MYLICNNLHLNIKVTYSICLLTNKINVHSLRENQQHEPTIKFKHLANSQFGISYALLFYRYERCEFPSKAIDDATKWIESIGLYNANNGLTTKNTGTEICSIFVHIY